MLNPEQIRQFHDQGFLVLENAFSAAEIASVRQAAENIVSEFDIENHKTVFKTSDRDAGRDDYRPVGTMAEKVSLRDILLWSKILRSL